MTDSILRDVLLIEIDKAFEERIKIIVKSQITSGITSIIHNIIYKILSDNQERIEKIVQENFPMLDEELIKEAVEETIPILGRKMISARKSDNYDD